MKIRQVPTDSVIPYGNNPRKNADAVEKVAASLEAFGWQQPIVVDKANVIIVGHTRWLAAQHLGMKKVPITVADKLTKRQVREYRIADNRTNEEADWDQGKLVEELQALEKAGSDLSSTGFDEREIGKMLAAEVEETEPEVIFSEELMEANNYVVLVFRNDVDWLAAQSHFNLQTRHSKRQNGKPWSAGIGRVVDGAEYLDSLEMMGDSKRRAQKH